VLGVAALGVVNAFAQSPTPTTPPNQNAPAQTNPFSTYENAFLNNLATRLGTTVDKLKQAFIGAFTDTVNQAVKDGVLTQSQATNLENKVNQGVQNGQFPGFFGFGHFNRGFEGHGFRGEFGILNMTELAKALNISESTLTSDLQSGKTIAQIAQAQNIPLSQVKTTILNDAKAQLDPKVTAGTITQAQEDQLLSNLGTKFDNLANQTLQNGFGRRWKVMPPSQNQQNQNQSSQVVPFQYNEFWQ